MPTPHAHDRDQVVTDGPPAPPAHAAGTPDWHTEPRPQPFTLRGPIGAGDPADPVTDQDRLKAALRAVQDAQNGLTNRHPATVHNPRPNDLDRARQLLDAAIGVARATTRNVIAPLEVRNPAEERLLIAERLGVHTRYVLDLLPDFDDDQDDDLDSPAGRVAHAIDTARRGGGWVELDVEDLTATAQAGLLEEMLSPEGTERTRRVPVTDCTCAWSEEGGSIDGRSRGTAAGAQQVHDMLLDLEDGDVDVWEEVLDVLLSDNIDCVPAEGAARLPHHALVEFVADHNWRDPARMNRMAMRLEMLCRYYAGEIGSRAAAERAARLSPAHQELVADIVEGLADGWLDPDRVEQVIGDPAKLAALSTSYQKDTGVRKAAGSDEVLTGEVVFRDSVEYLLGDLDALATDVRTIIEALDTGNGAAAVHGVHSLRDALADELGDLGRRLDHLWHTAGAYGTDNPMWCHRCCDQGVTEQESRQYAKDAGIPHLKGGRL